MLVTMVSVSFYIGMTIFEFIMHTVTVNTPNGKAPPLVTGTFGSRFMDMH